MKRPIHSEVDECACDTRTIDQSQEAVDGTRAS